MYRLHREGILAAQSPAGARDADILVQAHPKDRQRVRRRRRTQPARFIAEPGDGEAPPRPKPPAT